MTTALIWILTPVLIIDCLLLGLLVLIQLPKKEAGMGTAFGGGATDALFGAGSGTVLTKLTKYAAGIFFALVLLLNLLNIRAKPGSGFENALSNPVTEQPAAPPAMPAAPSAPATSNSAAGAATLVPQSLQMSNAPAAAAPASNAAGK